MCTQTFSKRLRSGLASCACACIGAMARNRTHEVEARSAVRTYPNATWQHYKTDDPASMAAVRTLAKTSLQRWSWSDDDSLDNVTFTITHDRSIDVILNNQRGEGFVKQVFRVLLSQCAIPGTGSVIDIGSNTGYYSMASAAHGCPVLAVDAQPGCRQWFEQARAANEAAHASSAAESLLFSTDRVRLVTQPVSNDGLPIQIDAWACWVMHKVDVRVRRRRWAGVSVASPPPPVSTLAAAAMLPPPPPLATVPGLQVPPGKFAMRPIDGAGLTRLLPPTQPVLLAKVDTEGAELTVMRALEPLLPRCANLLVEIAPGWWPLYANKSALRGGAARSRGAVHSGRTAAVAADFAVRDQGSQLLSRLLETRDEGGWGFSAALSSSGKHFVKPEQLANFLRRMGNNGYWHQVDMWFTRDARTMARARQLICLRQHASQRVKAMCRQTARRT